ncbi:MAG: XdhC family protein [Myxococcales bacterium]
MEDVHPELPAPPAKGARPRLVVVGAGDMSLPLVSLARTLGFHMTVVDPRPELATRERFPDADELRVGDAAEIVAELPLLSSTAVVLTIHDQEVEVDVLRTVLAREVGYVGMLGSRKRGRGVLDMLRERGVAPDRLGRVQVPVGLDIGARTAAEIALSVLAQIVAVRSGRPGTALAERSS